MLYSTRIGAVAGCIEGALSGRFVQNVVIDFVRMHSLNQLHIIMIM